MKVVYSTILSEFQLFHVASSNPWLTGINLLARRPSFLLDSRKLYALRSPVYLLQKSTCVSLLASV